MAKTPINYTQAPALTVNQQLQASISATGSAMSAVVVGPNYDLYRYGDEDIEATAFNADGVEIPYVYEKNPSYDYTVDTSYVTVNVEGLQAELASITTVLDDDDNMIIRTTDGKNFYSTNTAAPNLVAELYGSPIQVGDIVYSTVGETHKTRTVVGIVGKKIPAEIQDGVAGSGNNPGSGKVAPVLTGASADIKVATTAKYTGEADTAYVITCIKAPTADTSFEGAEFEVSDTAGMDVAQVITITAAPQDVNVGSKGLILTFNQQTADMGISIGDTFSFLCVADTTSATDFDGLQLNGTPVDLVSYTPGANITTSLRREYSGQVPSDLSPEAAWTADGTKVTVNEGMSYYISDRTSNQYVPFVDGIGSIYVTFRVLVIPPTDEDIFIISSTADIQNAFGTIAMDNPIAYGAWRALVGAVNEQIVAIRVRSNDVAGYTDGINKTKENVDTYSFAILSNDLAVFTAVEELINEASLANRKRWRIVHFPVETPGEYEAASRDSYNQILRATVSPDDNGNNVILQVANSDFDFRTIPYQGVTLTTRVGDYIQILGARYRIVRVLSDELLLETGPPTSITTPQAFSIIKADTADNATEYITAISSNYINRRVRIVWCDKGRDSSNTIVPNMYLAAEIAGAASYAHPHESLTRTKVTTIDSAALMYIRYNDAQLNTIASYGVTIVEQKQKGKPCYIRHDLTTETDKGRLYYEGSPTRNLDSISFTISDVLENYIGNANVVQATLEAITREVKSILIQYTTTGDGVALTSEEVRLLGPQVVRYDSLSVVQHPTLKDRIVVNVRLHLPLPLNNIDVYLLAIEADVTIDGDIDTTTTITATTTTITQ